MPGVDVVERSKYDEERADPSFQKTWNEGQLFLVILSQHSENFNFSALSIGRVFFLASFSYYKTALINQLALANAYDIITTEKGLKDFDY